MGDRPVVLVVEDEPDVAETYDLWLRDDYEVRRAADGPDALEMLNDEVDVVLLDRMMPGMSGDEVLERIRESDHDPKVAIVTAVDADFDVLEMGFDDYVDKPPTRDELRGVVEDLLSRRQYADAVQRYRALLSKRAALEAEMTERELATSDEYVVLDERVGNLESELRDAEEMLLDDVEFVGAIRDLAGGDSRPRREGE